MCDIYVRVDSVDMLTINGESILLFDDRFVRLSAVGSCIFRTAQTPRILRDLEAALIQDFGAPPDGASKEATSAAVETLLKQGVLRVKDRTSRPATHLDGAAHTPPSSGVS